MSRTWRSYPASRWLAAGQYWTERRLDDHLKTLSWFERRDFVLGMHYSYDYTGGQRDKKPWHKPPKFVKQERHRRERSKVRDAIHHGRDIPKFKRCDEWNWT